MDGVEFAVGARTPLNTKKQRALSIII